MVQRSDSDRPQPDRPLGEVAARGARLAFLGWTGSQGLMFVAYIVLAHLVSPRSFGTFTAGSLLIGFGLLFAESGTMAALISRRDRIEEAASTAFFSLLASGLALTVVAAAVSPLIGLFFKDATAGQAAAVLAGTLFLRTLAVVPDALLQRRMSFARRVAVDPLGAIAFAVVSIVACAHGLGVWGLVAGTYASDVAEVAAAWCFARFAPRWRLASMGMWREVAAFARPVLASEIVRRIASQMDIIMLGRFTSAATLGQYRNGARLAQQPGQAFVDVGAYVLLPMLAHIAEQPARLAGVVRRAYGLAVVAALPVSVATTVLGVPIAVLFLGDRWRPAGHAIAALWGLLAGGALGSVSAETIKAVGRPGLLVRMHSFNLVVTVVLVCGATIPFGLIGAASAVSVSQLAVGLYGVALAAPFTGVGFGALGREVSRPLIASGVMVGAMLLYAAAVGPLDHGEAWGLLLTGVEVALGGSVYVAALVTIDPRRRAELRRVIGRGLPPRRSQLV